MDKEQELKKVIESLSEEELNQLASGKMDPETKKKVAKWVGIGIGSANAVLLAGIGIAAIAGKVKHDDATHYLNPLNYLNKDGADTSYNIFGNATNKDIMH